MIIIIMYASILFYLWLVFSVLLYLQRLLVTFDYYLDLVQ